MISIIIPSYNHGDKISKAIESAMDIQTPHEIIIVNDGSTDNTDEIADFYAINFPEYIKVIHKDNGGLSSARNAGISEAKYDLILPLDADDELIPENIDKAISEWNQQSDILYGNTILYGRQYIPTKKVTLDLFIEGNQIYPTSIFKKRVWEEIGGYWECPFQKSIFEDWDFWGRAIKHGFKFQYTDIDFYKYNRTDDGMCITLSKEQEKNEKIIRDHLQEYEPNENIRNN